MRGFHMPFFCFFSPILWVPAVLNKAHVIIMGSDFCEASLRHPRSSAFVHRPF